MYGEYAEVRLLGRAITLIPCSLARPLLYRSLMDHTATRAKDCQRRHYRSMSIKWTSKPWTTWCNSKRSVVTLSESSEKSIHRRRTVSMSSGCAGRSGHFRNGTGTSRHTTLTRSGCRN